MLEKNYNLDSNYLVLVVKHLIECVKHLIEDKMDYFLRESLKCSK